MEQSLRPAYSLLTAVDTPQLSMAELSTQLARLVAASWLGETRRGKYSVVYSFTGGTDGFNPAGGLAKDSSGNIYGATLDGGSGGNGVIYKITP